MRRRHVLALAAATLAGASRAQPAAPARGHASPAGFSFALIGDIPYYSLEEQALRRIFQAFTPALSFAIHVGDIKSGSETCSDALIERRMALLHSCPIPLVLLPGDNEWVDCSRALAGGFDPLERLDFWRGLAARDQRADTVLGVQRHPAWPELMHWRMDSAQSSFVTLNVPGSSNGLIDTPQGRAQRRQRNAANSDWLARAGQRAQAARDRFLFVAIHAQTRLDRGPGGEEGRSPSPYRPFKQALLALLNHFSGQVIVLYGDSHQQHVDHPWESLVGKRLMSVECFGSPFNGAWVRIDVDPRQASPQVTVQALG